MSCEFTYEQIENFEMNKRISPEARFEDLMLNNSIRELADYPDYLLGSKDLHFHFAIEQAGIDRAITPAFASRELAEEAMKPILKAYPRAKVVSNTWRIGCGHRATSAEYYEDLDRYLRGSGQEEFIVTLSLG